MAILTVLGPLKKVDESWYEKLYYDFRDHKLSWPQLVAKIQSKANQTAEGGLQLAN
ncbi:hypothetical protein SCUP515_13357, partial [Seiridium cupressi]